MQDSLHKPDKHLLYWIIYLAITSTSSPALHDTCTVMVHCDLLVKEYLILKFTLKVYTYFLEESKKI